jgi:hypothetical protein
MSSSEASDSAFVAAGLTLYANLPDTPLRPSAVDQFLARRLFTDALPLPLIESAFLLAPLRRWSRPPALPPLPKIRSLASFLPVIDELRLPPLPDGDLHYLRRKLRTLSPGSSEKCVF